MQSKACLGCLKIFLAIVIVVALFPSTVAGAYVPAKPVYVYALANWITPPLDGTASVNVSIKYYAYAPTLYARLVIFLPNGVLNSTGGNEVIKEYLPYFPEGILYDQFNVTIGNVTPTNNELVFRGVIDWVVVVDNVTRYYTTPISFALPYYGSPYFSVIPLQTSLSVGENKVMLLLNTSQVPIYNLSLVVDSVRAVVDGDEANVSVFVPSSYYLSFYPLSVEASFSTPYGYMTYSRTFYLFVNQTVKSAITYDVLSSPDQSYLVPGKDLVVLYLNNTFGVTFYGSWVRLLFSNGSYTSELLEYLGAWRPGKVVKLYALVYSSGPVSIEAYVSNASGNITGLGEVVVPVKNVEPIQLYYYEGNLTVVNGLSVPVDNLTVYGFTFSQIPPDGKASVKMSIPSPLANVTYYIENYKFTENLVVNVSQPLNFTYTFANGQLYITLHNSYVYPISDIYLASSQLSPNSYYLGSLGVNSSATVAFQPLSGNVSLEITYYVNGTQHVEEAELYLGNLSPELVLEGYKIAPDGNALTLVLYVKNVGNVEAYDSYAVVSSASANYFNPTVFRLGPLAPNEEEVAYYVFSENYAQYNITVTLLYGYGNTIYNKTYTIEVENNYISPVVKYIDLGFSLLGYSVDHVPVLFIVGIVLLLVLVLAGRGGKK